VRPNLSKTRYQWGLQCKKRLWLDARHRELATPPDAGLRSRLHQGHRVGALARARWAGSVLVTEPAARHARAEAVTRELLADPTVPAICEGAFSFEGLRVRVDVLVRRKQEFDLIEVKSATRMKPEYVSDAAVQLRVLQGAGVPVRRVALLHLNRDYVWDGTPYDLERLFTLADIDAEARAAAKDVDATASTLRDVLISARAPEIDVGRHCEDPHPCPFRAYCWRDVDFHHICELPGLDEAAYRVLVAEGRTDIARLQRGSIELSAEQELVRSCIAGKRRYLNAAAIAEAFDSLDYPIIFIGLVFAQPALPLFAGDRPYEPIPVAWSISVAAADGSVRTASFNADDGGDPRPALFEALAAALPESGNYLVYGGDELERLIAASARCAPVLADGLRARATDLRSLVEAHFYDPALAGTHALDAVHATLVGAPAGRPEGDPTTVLAERIARDCPPSRRAMLGVWQRDAAEMARDALRNVFGELIAAVQANDADE